MVLSNWTGNIILTDLSGGDISGVDISNNPGNAFSINETNDLVIDTTLMDDDILKINNDGDLEINIDDEGLLIELNQKGEII